MPLILMTILTNFLDSEMIVECIDFRMIFFCACTQNK